MENYNDELYHHGTLGMKWGIRRYQNKDGSLKPAGEKRYGSGKSLGQTIKDYKVSRQRKKNLEKARQARVEKKKAEEQQKKDAIQRQKDLEAGKIPLKKMTNEEIQAKIDRINLEKSYQEAMRDNQNYTRTKRFLNKFLDSTIDKCAENTAADVVAQTMKVVLTKGVNKALESKGFNADVHTNNKKK